MLLQVGILCNSLPRTDAAVSAGGREECDHMRLLVDMMNDKEMSIDEKKGVRREMSLVWTI